MNIAERNIPELMEYRGETVKGVAQWRSRRKQILALLEREVYGKSPEQFSVSFEVNAQHAVMEERAVEQHVSITVTAQDGKCHSFPMELTAPVEGNAPVFLILSNRMPPEMTEKFPSMRPVGQLLERGYATAILYMGDVQPDSQDNALPGIRDIFPLCGDGTDWGTIAAWAFGASRCMDYLQQEPLVNAKRVGLFGFSRGGKAALWCACQDERFAMVISNDSGCTGAALSRGNTGEQIKNINQAFPHWFCGNYQKYNDKVEALPVDQHMVLACIAPRGLYVASGSEDAWCDPQSEFAACVLAQKAWELYGRKGLGSEIFPGPNTRIPGGGIGYHLRNGGHVITPWDWKGFLDYADLNMK